MSRKVRITTTDRPKPFSQDIALDADSLLNDLRTSQAHFDRFWGRCPTFHISQKQFVEWGRHPAIPLELDDVAKEVREGVLLPPFDAFAVAIDECDGYPSWIEQRDISGVPVLARCLGFVVEVALEDNEPSLVIVERTRINVPRAPASGKYFRLDAKGLAITERLTYTSSLVYRTSNSEGGYILDPTAKPTEADISALKSAAKRTLRRIFSLLFLLNDRVFLPYDPLANANRATRRQAKLDAEKHGHTNEHYRIFLRRKKKRGGTGEHGVGTPHAFQEPVRAHRRVYKSGRIAIIKPHVRGKEKPPRPGTPQYDVWAIDEATE